MASLAHSSDSIFHACHTRGKPRRRLLPYVSSGFVDYNSPTRVKRRLPVQIRYPQITTRNSTPRHRNNTRKKAWIFRGLELLDEPVAGQLHYYDGIPVSMSRRRLDRAYWRNRGFGD